MSEAHEANSAKSAQSADTPQQLRPAQVAAIAASLLAGLAIQLIGLPDSISFAGSPLSAYTTAAAIAVALLGICLVGVWVAHVPWRVNEIVIGAVLGVASGVAFWLLAQSWQTITAPLSFWPPAKAILTGVWLLPGVLGALVLRRPGAALYVELVAATLEGLLPNGFGVGTIVYGIVQGLAVEVVFAVLLYRVFGRVAALAAGAVAGVAAAALDLTLYYPDYPGGQKFAYVVLAAVSGAIIAGLGAVALAAALGRAGALSSLASGRDVARV